MGQVLHRGATTTEAVRRAIQHSHEILRRLARRHGINPKTREFPRAIRPASMVSYATTESLHCDCAPALRCIAGARREPFRR
jgi:hypothetical protein